MDILSKIWFFLNSKVFLYITIGIALFFFVNTCSKNTDLKKNIKRQSNNILALNDTITIERTKTGDLQVSVDGYVASEKELKSLNKDLYIDVKNQKGKVITLNNIVIELKQDTSELRKYIRNLKDKVVQVNDSTYDLRWVLYYDYDSINFDRFRGNTRVNLRNNKVIRSKTELRRRDSRINLTYGQKWEDDRVRVFAQSSYPGFTAASLEGVYVDFPKKRHWFQGFGIGPNFTMGYDFLHNQPAIIIGVGIQYNVYHW